MTRVRSFARRLRRAHTRIAARLLLFNVLLVFLPVAGLVYLDAYERHLLEQQERAMVDAGRVVAAALSGDATDPAAHAQALAARLGGATDARFRVIDRNGRVIADSASSGPAATDSSPEATTASSRDEVRTSWLYRTGAALGRGARRLFWSPPPIPASESIVVAPGVLDAPELDVALQGGYGARTRLSPGGQRSVTLYSALPIRTGAAVTGAVLVSQSTWRILQRLYDVRLRMFSVVVVSLGFAVVLMLVSSFTIVTPVRQLRDDAESLADRRGRLTRRFRGTDRQDEIGELARALDDLTSRLEAHLRFTERFAADVTHEFRNPLASIRASAEMLADADRPDDRTNFRSRIERDISRLEALLYGVRALTAIDAQLEEEPRTAVDVRAVVREAVAGRESGCHLRLPDTPLVIEASADRILQVLTNLIDNAQSFSPPGAAVEIAAERVGGQAIVTVRDRGPGIAPEHLERVFDRFFCHRPGQPDARSRHTGLGLSIARTIAESYGGQLRAANHPGGGAVLELVLLLRA